MPSIETSIWLALRAHITSLVLTPALPIAWPNEDFTKPGPKLGYLRVTWIPNLNRRRAVTSSGTHQRLSLLQIDVFAPKNQNVAVAMEIAGKVAEHFPADQRMAFQGVRARVTAAPQIAQPINDDTHILVPVTVSIEVLA
jgi:hypothetical protein